MLSKHGAQDIPPSQDARGHVTGEILGGGAVRTGRAFDAKTGRIRSITGQDALDRPVQALSYRWGLVGNLRQRSETSLGKTLEETFTYDSLGRLTTAQVGSNTAQTLTYDALGNITCKSDVDHTDCTLAGRATTPTGPAMTPTPMTGTAI